MTAADVRYRHMLAEDIPAVLTLWEQAGLDNRPIGRDAPEALTQQLGAMGRHFWLAELDGRIVGAVLGTHDSRKGWINRLAVHPDFRRRGLARALLARVEQSLAEDGIEIFTALIDSENEASCRAFESTGYEEYPVHYFRKLLRPSV
jgi:ribosomal protein S18 acetylase RimI-like enzyme